MPDLPFLFGKGCYIRNLFDRLIRYVSRKEIRTIRQVHLSRTVPSLICLFQIKGYFHYSPLESYREERIKTFLLLEMKDFSPVDLLYNDVV